MDKNGYIDHDKFSSKQTLFNSPFVLMPVLMRCRISQKITINGKYL